MFVVKKLKLVKILSKFVKIFRFMREILVLFFLLVSCLASATDYYISSSGDDINNTGLSSSSPWKTLSKVNSIFSSINPGDRILFKRGDTFFGTLNITKSGTLTNPIIIGSFGEGSYPVITGFYEITDWNQETTSIYSKVISPESFPNMVAVNEVNTQMGRWPDTGWRYYENNISGISLVDNELSGEINWTGAEVVICVNAWTIERKIITNHSNNNISWTGATNLPLMNGCGYFIQNDLRTLNDMGDWYYDQKASKFYMYFGLTDPKSVVIRVSLINTLLSVINQSYINIQEINLQGSNSYGIYLSGSNNISLNGCIVDYCGNYGLYCFSSKNLIINNNNFKNVNGNGIYLEENSENSNIAENIIENTGILPGMVKVHPSGINSSCHAITSWSPNTKIQYNKILNTGYIGIFYWGNNNLIDSNFIDYFCLTKEDGAAIYTSTSSTTGTEITNNIILNGGVGSKTGYPKESAIMAHGIYCDANSGGITISGNTVANCSYSGLYIHSSDNHSIINNTCYNNYMAQILFAYSTGWDYVRGIKMDNNKFIVRTLAPSTNHSFALFFIHWAENGGTFGISDNNYYSRPLDDDEIFYFWPAVSGDNYKTLEEWKILTGQDSKSGKSSVAIKSGDELKFEYNSSRTDKTILLDKPMVDIEGNKYANTLVLSPFRSVVLMPDPNPSAQPVIPTYTGSVVENDTPSVIEIHYNVNLANIVPSTSAFSVQVNSITRNISSVAISGHTVLLTLVSPIVFGNTITVAYTKPSSNPLQSISGGQAATIGQQSVTNNVNAIFNPPVVVIPPPVVPPPPVTVPNSPPTININYAKSTNSGFIGTIDASTTYDVNKDNLAFTWTIPDNIPVSSTTGSVINFLAPVVNSKQTYNFVLKVSDGKSIQTKTIPIEIIPYQTDLEAAKVVLIMEDGSQSNSQPYNIIDGNIGTSWSAFGEQQSIILKLANPFKIEYVTIAFNTGQKREFYFDVYASEDSLQWEPVLIKSVSCSFSGNPQTFDFPVSKSGQKFRYVKIVGNGNSTDKWNYIAELKIVGYRYRDPSEYEYQLVKIYPNPANEIINILIDEPTFLPDFIKILTINGKIIYSDIINPGLKLLQIPVNFRKGIYIIQMGVGDMTRFTQKLVVL